MKKQKYVIVFTLIVALLLIAVSGVVKASDSPLDLQVDNQTQNNEANDQVNNEVINNQVQNNTVQNNVVQNNAVNNSKTNSLPQTGVAEDTALFIFISICIVSAIYAFIKIRNYKNI